MFAVFTGAQLSLFTVFLGHGTALISVTPPSFSPAFKKWTAPRKKRRSILAQTPWQTFWRVTLPNLKLSLIAAGLSHLHALHGRDRRHLFLIGRDNTLPLEIWGRLRRGITPEINAVSTLIFAVSVGLIVIWYRVRVRGLAPMLRPSRKTLGGCGENLVGDSRVKCRCIRISKQVVSSAERGSAYDQR